MTSLWLLVPTVLAVGVVAAVLVARRLADAITELGRASRRIEHTRLATVTVQDDLAVLRATLAERHRR